MKKAGETAAHLLGKNVVSSTLSTWISSRSAQPLRVTNRCGSVGRHFMCNAWLPPRDWLSPVPSSTDIKMELSCAALSSRFDVALVAKQPELPASASNNPETAIRLLAETPGAPLTLKGLTGADRRSLHLLCDELRLMHESIGSGRDRAMRVWRPELPSYESALTLAVKDVLGVFEIFESSAMIDAKVSALQHAALPFVELDARYARRWTDPTAPLKAVRHSLKNEICATCKADPLQDNLIFEKVAAIHDITFRRRRRVERHMFAQLRHQTTGSVFLVRHPSLLLSRRWHEQRAEVLLHNVPFADADALVQAELARVSKRSHAVVTERVAFPGVAPSDLFPEGDVIGSNRTFQTARQLFPSLDRLFGTK